MTRPPQAPEKSGEKKSGKGRNTKTTTVTAPDPRIVDLAWTQSVKREERNLLTGTYVIETSHTDKTSQEIWSLYTTLTQVEDVFRSLKSDLGIRPVFHQKADRCRPTFLSRSWPTSFSRTSSTGSARRARHAPGKRSAPFSAPSAEPPSRGPPHRFRLPHPDDLETRTGTPGDPRQARHQEPSPPDRLPLPSRKEGGAGTLFRLQYIK